MSLTAFLLTLTIAGGIAELAGISLGVKTLRARARLLRDFENNPPPVQSTAGPALSFSRAHPIGIEGTPIEDRVAALERRLEDQHDELMSVIGAHHEAAVTAAAHNAQDVDANLRAVIDRLRALLTGVARDDPTAVGALVLLVSGLLLQTASNIIQIATT